MHIDHASMSDPGQVRPNNEDACGGFVPEGEEERRSHGVLFVVADGMGGHRGGEIASRLAIETVSETYFATDGSDRGRALGDAFEEANRTILEHSVTDQALFGMGTTCTALALQGGQAWLAHVGDSRAYRYRSGELIQLSRDHSLVGEMVRSGIISDEDARHHPRRHVITRSLGVQETVETDVFDPLEVEVGDVFVLCSDGLTTYVADEDIARILEEGEPAEECRRLVEMANGRGGRDNITVLIALVRSL